MYKRVLKPLMFMLDPEKAHHLTMNLFEVGLQLPIVQDIIRSNFHFENPSLEREVMGLKFKNPVGLAAGFDKDGKYFHEMAELGFGFIEIGTVTPKPQNGNPKPRLFRIPKDQGLINRMGFNNEGVDKLVSRLQNIEDRDYIIGGNIGKNKSTPNDQAVEDYAFCFNKLHSYVDYFVVNVSSPNTPGLRELQEKKPLERILSELVELNLQKSIQRPLLLKIAPDLHRGQIDEVLEILADLKIDGLIINNTSINRNQLSTSDERIHTIGNGGLSGKPIRNLSREMLHYVQKNAPKSLTKISVGGISTPEEGKFRLENGADLIQLYSGLVYYGPRLVKNTLEVLN